MLAPRAAPLPVAAPRAAGAHAVAAARRRGRSGRAGARCSSAESVAESFVPVTPLTRARQTVRSPRAPRAVGGTFWPLRRVSAPFCWFERAGRAV